MKQIGTHQGKPVMETVLESSHAAVSIMSYGAVVRDWRVDVAGSAKPMVLGYPVFDLYPEHSRAFGTIAGRVANRIANGRFTLEGKDYALPINNGPNHLHGGPEGLGKQVWEMDPDGTDAVRLTHRSPDGHMGYPGTVDFTVTYRLDGPRLIIEMEGQADRPTPINLAQHNYYTLGAETGISHCLLRMDAPHYTPVDEPVGAEGGAADSTLIPTGEVRSVKGSRFDFTDMKPIRDGDGIDINMVLRAGRAFDDIAAEATNPETGIGLKLWTDQPGCQFFDAHHFDLPMKGLDGITMKGWPGFCLEPQHFPDSVNKPDWPSIIYGPDRPYSQRLEVEIA
ncbi:aldose 1-epimerase [Rubricella aquisinus]|uniref:Aldose 1-epimerase n=1 Tax=Rubricella aquisinus TaxID=2028108 RepID=A0A840WJG9_9RHOB|nr:aldose epimerase family protein [Rubricella aquisinus]MBB5514661.1 aldose 1-epimerase [Rubricella aquisinus]